MDDITAQLTAIVPTARSLEQLTRPMLEMLAQSTGMESTYLTGIDVAAGRQWIQFARNAGAGFAIPEGLSVPWGDTLCKRALEERRIHADDVPERWGDVSAARLLGIRSFVSAPIHAGDGQLLGTLCAASPQQRPLDGNASNLLRLLSALVGQMMEREKLVEQLAATNAQLAVHAMTDPLTGLPNRRAVIGELQRMLARARREGTCVLVGIADLDGFKAINDVHGHQVGDAFLMDMSVRLCGALRATDLVGRLGGDEFVILGPGPAACDPEKSDTEAGAGTIACAPAARMAADTLQARCASATEGAFTFGDCSFHYVGASVGVVAVDPQKADADEALRLADEAMYETKRSRRPRQAA